MNEKIDRYLAEVNFRLLGIERAKRRSIIKELKGHLAEKLQSTEPLTTEEIRKIITELGTPKELATKYKELYGYSSSWKLSFIVFAVIISIFTLPIFELSSLIFLPIAFLWIVYISLKTGKKLGTIIGGICGFTRIVAIVLLIRVYPTTYTVQNDFITIAGFLITSGVMLLLGYLPGYYKK
jgi:hypothetical protein